MSNWEPPSNWEPRDERRSDRDPPPPLPPPPSAPLIPIVQTYDPLTPDYLGAGAAGVQRPVGNAPYSFTITPMRLRDGSLVYYWRLIIYDLRGGLNRTLGDVVRDYDRLSSSNGIETRFYETACLNLLQTAATTPDPTGNAIMCHARIFGTTMFGIGSGDDVSLYSETSATNPVVIAVTGVGTGGRGNTGGITCLEPMVTGGATAARGLLQGLAGAAPRYLTDALGTIGATGHANLNPTWAAKAMLDNNYFLANGGIWVLPKTSAISAAPTQLYSNIANGGADVGLCKRGGGPARWYFWVPYANNTTGGYVFGSEVAGEVRSINGDGGDMQPVDFRPYLNDVTWACIYRDGALATDGERYVWNNGNAVVDLGHYTDREANSDREYRERGGWVIGGEFYARTNYRAALNGAGSTIEQIEWLDFRTLSWHGVGAQRTLSGTGNFGALSPGSLPWSSATRFLHHYVDGSWLRQSWVPAGQNPYMFRKTVGATATTGLQYGPAAPATGIGTMPKLRLQGLEGLAKGIWRITYLGENVDSGDATTGSTVRIEDVTSGVGFTFVSDTAYANVRQIYDVPASARAAFDLLQPRITLTQQTGGTDPTRHTPNGVPFMFEGFAWGKGLGMPDVELMLPGG